MSPPEVHTVTGAFGYSGRYIASRLLASGFQVRTLTDSPNRANPFGGHVEIRPFAFDDSEMLRKNLEGTKVLYNTYWVRFDHADFCHATAVENTRRLFDAARSVGVERVVHVSITNPSEDSALPYFHGKAVLERCLKESGVSYAILRPTVLFGPEDILINNIAWMLRHFPIFGVFGDGQYSLQPIFVDDLASMATMYGLSRENVVVDAIGPETFTYRELVSSIGSIIGCPRPIIGLPPSMAYAFGRILGAILDDVIITREEVEGLMKNLLLTNSAPAGQTRLTTWAAEHAEGLGLRYASELARRRNRMKSYGTL